ncbi:MAG: hypothetical protein ACO36I_21430 [Candidatus Latescibacterota bacterium]|jgi:hypothetical protein
MPPRKDTRRSRQRQTPEQQARELPYSGRNIRFFAIGVVFILAGYFFTSRPPVDGFMSLTLAPILLVLGYCVFIPIALLIGEKKDASQNEAPATE